MRFVLASVALAALLAGCGAASNVAEAPKPTTLSGTLGYHPASPPFSGPTAAPGALAGSEPSMPPARKLLCDAPSLTYLVGRARTEIPVPADLSHRRVVCTTCPSSDDYKPDRTDIVFDAKTGIIKAVTCG